MNLMTTLGKHAIVGSLLAVTGLPASMAQAQFKVEYRDSNTPPKAESVEKEEKQVIVVQSHDGEHKYEIKLVNGVLAFASLDGDEIDHKHIGVGSEKVIFFSDDGKVMHEIKMPGMAAKSGKAKAPEQAPGAVGWVTDHADGKGTWVADFADEKNNQFFLDATKAAQPKVMLGINLSEPDDAMRKQLKLGADQKVILVEKVIKGLPAKKAGLEDYDVIISIDGSDYADGELLGKVMQKKSAGDDLKLVVLREGEKMKIVAKLTKYNAEKLGVVSVNVESPFGTDFPHAMPNTNQQNQFVFAPSVRDNLHGELHEHLMHALEASGLDEEHIHLVQERLHERLGDLGHFFSADGTDFTIAVSPDHELHEHEEHAHAEHERAIEFAVQQEAGEEKRRYQVLRELEFAEVAREKARDAMRDAERQVMEMRDGRLIVRSAEKMESELAQLEDRLNALEDRLGAQMSRFESQMDRIADMFERLMDRLED